MEDIITISIRTTISFIVILLFYRLTGKKELGEISVLDIGITLMIADLTTELIIEPEDKIYIQVLPIAVLITIQYLLSFITMKSKKARDIIDGVPSFIIYEGKCQQKMMKKLGYNLDDLYMQLRDKDITEISDVSYAILESSGNLTVFKKTESFSLPVILDGEIHEKYLHLFDKDEQWLLNELRTQGYPDPTQIFVCSYNKSQLHVEQIDNTN